jgi:hypothetical protein
VSDNRYRLIHYFPPLTGLGPTSTTFNRFTTCGSHPYLATNAARASASVVRGE